MEPGSEALDDVMGSSLVLASLYVSTGSSGQVGSTTSPSGKSLSSIPEKQERIPPPLSESITSLLHHQRAWITNQQNNALASNVVCH